MGGIAGKAPGFVKKPPHTLGNAKLKTILQKYRAEVSELRPMGRTKKSHIRYLEKCAIARMPACEIEASDIIAHTRSRRPTPGELDSLTRLFKKRDRRRSNIPMNDIIWFAIHSARRQGEITQLPFSDNDDEHQTGVVRDLKHPSDRDQIRRFKYTPEAWEIVSRQNHEEDRIFTYEPMWIGSAFRQACKLLDVQDFHFHDLRHEATSRLFETGYSIVEVQQFTLHDSWGTLSRYTHLRAAELVTITHANGTRR